MSSIMRTIDALRKIRLGDYVGLHRDRLGYVEKSYQQILYVLLKMTEQIILPG